MLSLHTIPTLPSRFMLRSLLLLLFIGCLAASAHGAEKLQLAPVFQTGMVLQQGLPIPIWGTTTPETKVKVVFAEQTKQTTSAADGRWKLLLDPLAAHPRGRELSVTAGEQTQTLRDVLVGEVWLAAGQSNMEFRLNQELHANEEIPQADRPHIRLLNYQYAGQNYGARPFDAEVLARLTPEEFYRGNWENCSPKSAASFSAVGYYFAKELEDALHTPVGIIHLAVGGSPTEAWLRRGSLADSQQLTPLLTGNWLENKSQEPWCQQRGRENLATGLKQPGNLPADDGGPNHPFKPSFLWDAGIAKLMPFPIRGVLWYQGESNSLSKRRVEQHAELFPLLVADWRATWKLGDIPFYYCQLSSIGTERGYQSHHWPEFRDQQRRFLSSIRNTGMAVTSDLGDRSDVHPKNKREVGKRLALWALAKTYQREITPSGPLAARLQREGKSFIAIHFQYGRGLKSADAKPLVGFEIAGEDRVFHTATADIRGEQVLVSSSEVPQPTLVRYAWQPFASGNLANEANLPASTFWLELNTAE